MTQIESVDYMILDWNLDPIAINIFGNFSIRYYSVFFILGLALGYIVVKKYWLKEGHTKEELDKLATYVFIATILGARIGHCLFYEPEYYLSHPLEILLPISITDSGIEFTGFQGLASHGGILAVFIAIYLFCRKFKKDFFQILDMVAVGGALAGVFIRLANFMNSEIIGVPTEANYGVIFRRIDDLARHPAQLYEALAYLLIFLLLYYLRKTKKLPSGVIFALFFTLLFTARFLIEFFKIDQVAFEQAMTLNMGQWLSIPFVILGLILLYNRYNKSKKS